MKLPEVTEVQRLMIKPGDRLIVHVKVRLDAQTAHRVQMRVREVLNLPPDVNVLVLDEGASMVAVDGVLSVGDVSEIREIMRAAMDNPGKAASIGADGKVLVTDIGGQ